MSNAQIPGRSEHIYALPNGTNLHEYEIRGVLGFGGFGITYLAFDTLLNELVAIKEYLPGYLAARFSDRTVGPKSENDRAAFEKGVETYLNEARTIARFRHHNVTQVRRYFQLNGTGYIVLSHEDGVSLDRLLEKGPVPQEQLRNIFLGALSGLEIVHEAGVLHRDIKPNNIILRPDGSPVLIDFGAAREFEIMGTNMTTIMSPGYAPPEQYGEGGQQGFWTDFYALGATAYQCITGRRPEDSLYRLQLSRANKDPLVPAEKAGAGRYEPAFLRCVDWMLRLNENERPQTIADIRKGLEPSGNKKLQLKASPRPTRWKPIAAAAAAVLLLGGGIYMALVHFNAEPPQQIEADVLKDVGYDRDRIEQALNSCSPHCSAHTTDEARRRLRLLDDEEADYRSAGSDPDRLSAYTQNCIACEHKADAMKSAIAIQAKAVAEEQARLERLRAEDKQYKDARDNPALLRAYLQSCSTCTYKDEAENRLSNLRAKTSDDVTKPVSNPEPDRDLNRDAEIITASDLLDEIRNRLYEQNLEVGAPGSQEMINALHAFEHKAGLPTSDRPTTGLLRSLREAPSLEPWAAIVYAKEEQKWGMAWNASTRRGALADARARCGSDKCFAAVSFFAGRCGAFAASAQTWGMAWRTDIGVARQAAVDNCEKRGVPCRLIGAVCADGSGRAP